MRFVITFFVCVATQAASSVASEGLAPLSPQELAQQLLGVEGKIQDVDVAFASTSQSFVGPDAGMYTNQVRWAFRTPFGSRFRLEQSAVKPWDRGAEPTLAQAGTVAFDGTDSWTSWQFGTTLEDALNASAVNNILSGRQPGVMLGEGYIDLTLWRYREPLSTTIQRVDGATVASAELDGRPVYRLLLPWNGKMREESIGPEAVYLDPSRGFAVLRVEKPPVESGTVSSLINVTGLAEPVAGVWLPVNAVWEHWGNGGLASSWQCAVESIAVNSGLDDHVFTIDYDAGSTVSDLRSRITFRIGVDSKHADEQMEAQSNAAHAAVGSLAKGGDGYLPILHAEFVPESKAMQATAGPRSEFVERLLVPVLLVGGVTAAVVGCVAVRIRRKRPLLSGIFGALGLAGVVVASTGLYGRLEGSFATKANSLNAGTSDTSRAVFDCGRTVLGVLAKYYNTAWKAEDIVAATGTEPGMSLLQIRDAARAMGLEAQGVRVSSPKELRELLAPPQSALVLATSVGENEEYQAGHFLCTVGANDQHFVMVDPPRPVHLMTIEDAAKVLSRGKGYAVMVRSKN